MKIRGIKIYVPDFAYYSDNRTINDYGGNDGGAVLAGSVRAADEPYALLAGYMLTESGKKKVPGAGSNTIVDLNALDVDDIADVSMVGDIALFNGMNELTFTFSPAEVIAAENELFSSNSSLPPTLIPK